MEVRVLSGQYEREEGCIGGAEHDMVEFTRL